VEGEVVIAVEALKVARAAGIDIRLEGDDLVLEAESPAASDIIDLLSRNKRDIVALLRPGFEGRSAEDWHILFAKRVAIAELQCGLPRPEAEARAFECCVVEWMNRNFVVSPPGRCLACGGNDHRYDAVLPFGVEPIGRAWLHSRCWPAWHADRRTEAIAALAVMGIALPTRPAGATGP
jgi:hypothetical protein